MPTPQEHVAFLLDQLKSGKLKLGELKARLKERSTKGTVLEKSGPMAVSQFENFVNKKK